MEVVRRETFFALALDNGLEVPLILTRRPQVGGQGRDAERKMETKEAEFWGEEFQVKTVSDLCKALEVSRQAVWQAIQEGRIPTPLRVGPRTRIWPPQVFAAIVAKWESSLQDKDTQKKMKQALRLRGLMRKAQAAEAKARAALERLGPDFQNLPEPEEVCH